MEGASLTPAEARVYKFIRDFMAREQMAPSYREIRDGLELHSPAPVQAALNKLRAKGYVDWKERTARSIKLLK